MRKWAAGIVLVLAGVILGVPSASAIDWSVLQYDPGGAKFSDHELSLDLAGIYGTRNREDFHGDALGFGVGVNYFFSRYLGASAETYLDDFDYPNHLDAHLIGRYPLENLSLAPYVFAGFGRQFHDVPQWTGDIGIGVDYRLNTKAGVFLDVRDVFADVSKDFVVWRLGVRYRFW